MLRTSASELEKLQRKKRKNPDPGFTGEILTLGIVRIGELLLNLIDYAQAQLRKYERLTKQIQPDMEAYQEQKLEM